jgi:hypothetical protein
MSVAGAWRFGGLQVTTLTAWCSCVCCELDGDADGAVEVGDGDGGGGVALVSNGNGAIGFGVGGIEGAAATTDGCCLQNRSVMFGPGCRALGRHGGFADAVSVRSSRLLLVLNRGRSRDAAANGRW